MTATKSEKVPRALETKFGEIVAITDAFAVTHLDDEYRQLIRYAVAALCRKRPSPLEKGRVTTWACAVTHAIGMVNFLFDPSQNPHMKVADLYRAFGIGQSTGQGKSKLVRDLLRMGQLDPEWTLPSRVADNPMVWMLMVDGMIVDIRRMPRELQEAAFAKGVIPYIPADGQKD
jgi:hypothetical protein